MWGNSIGVGDYEGYMGEHQVRMQLLEFFSFFINSLIQFPAGCLLSPT